MSLYFLDRHSMIHDLTPVYPYSYTDDYSYTKQTEGNILQIDNDDLTRTHAYYSYNILGDVTVTKQYAIQGELTKELHLTWNDDHRLIEVKDGASQTLATYTYNGLGQRVEKVANGVTTIFLYDLQGNIISEIRDDGTYDDYLYLENQRIAKIFNGEGTDYVYYYHNDHLGTPIAMTDQQGSVVWKAAYKTFGEAVVDSASTITNNFRFPGQYYDQETGLHYNYQRYYDPGTGRYLTSDPIGLKGGINLYVYVLNNPITKIDILGLKEAGYGGWELQNIIGYGETTITCCSGSSLMRHKYKKLCYGAGFIAGISGGIGFNSQGKNCNNPSSYFITPEFGFGLIPGMPLGIEGGIAYDPQSGNASPFIGGGFGRGFKATVCVYWLTGSEKIGCCGK